MTMRDSAGTGEIVVGRKLGEEAVFLTPIRHDPEAAFRRKYRLSEARRPLSEAVRGGKGEGAAKDYLDHDVWAVWRKLPGLDWGLVVRWPWTRPSPH